MGDLPEGGAAAELRPMASHSTPFAEPNPSEIGTINWATAERAACEIIRKVQPNSVSDERRKKVVDYIQRLIRNCLGAEVFPYGSVPLKTYLPDGDIDLTTFGGANVEDTLADDMKTILEEEERKVSAEFSVKDVQLVRAEVKLVKCIVQDIVVDVSFNQIGGLCTLCFLEQVDRLIGKNHLFKRSIILIKAWCYYESRILGAHHGLISTYALETMVLYIFHLFHSTLDGPLAVLFKFLDYFSKFDWETYCISLNGPVWVSSLPAILVEMPEDRDKDLLLSSDFLSSCISMFSVPSRGGDKNSRGFQPKHLNIFDPLKEINNLGRSVSKGNFYRIRSAFSYGARKLARILLQPADSIDNELHKFFPNTVARHGGGQRPDVQVIDKDDEAVASSTGSARSSETAESSNSSNLSGDYESYLRCLHYGRWCYESGLGLRSLPLAPMYQSNSPWDGGVLPLPHYKQNGGLSYRHHNGPHPGPAVFALPPVLLPGVTFGWEEMPKPRGTGTYFPNTNQLPQGYRSSTVVKGKNQAPSKSSVRNNGRNATFTEASVPERSGHEVPQPSPRRDGHPNANALFIQHEGGVDFASVERGPGTSASEQSRRQKPVSSSPRTLSGVQRSPSSLSKEQDRILLGSSYRLKDEDDFPPLPV